MLFTPSPSRTLASIAAFNAVRWPAMTPALLACLIAAAATTGGCCKPRRSGTSPAISASASASSFSRQILLRPGDDGPPDTWTSAHDSQKAAPEYAQAGGFAPQLDDALKEQLFAEPHADAVMDDASVAGQSLVLCRLEYSGCADTGVFKGLFNASRAELEVRLQRDGMPDIVEQGPEDRDRTIVSVPLVESGSQKPWVFVVADRDGGFSRDHIGKVVVPATLAASKNGELSVACRRFERQRVEQLFASQLVQVDRSMAEVAANLEVDPRDPTLGLEPVRDSLRREMASLASLVGWADPRVVRRREWGTRMLQALRADRAKLVADQAKLAPRRAQFQYARGTYEAQVLELTCEATAVNQYSKLPRFVHANQSSPIGCLLRIETKNLGPDPYVSDPGGRTGWSVVVARADGETRPATFLALEGPELTPVGSAGVPGLAPGATGTVVFGLAADADGRGDESKRARVVVMNPFMHDSTVYLGLNAVVQGR